MANHPPTDSPTPRRRVALITGGSGDIGAAIARALSQTGVDIVVGYRERKAAATALVHELHAQKRRALCLQADITSREQVRTMIAQTIDAFGTIDILINNAGVLQQKPFQVITDEDWDHTLAVNLKGAFLCIQEVLPLMLAQRSGRIVNMASSGGQVGGSLAPHYAASKAGVVSLTRSLARLAAPDVCVNCVAPGLIDTRMTEAEIDSEAGTQKLCQIPLGHVGTVEDVAASVVFLATSAPYITGHTLNVNGGLYFG